MLPREILEVKEECFAVAKQVSKEDFVKNRLASTYVSDNNGSFFTILFISSEEDKILQDAKKIQSIGQKVYLFRVREGMNAVRKRVFEIVNLIRVI